MNLPDVIHNVGSKKTFIRKYDDKSKYNNVYDILHKYDDKVISKYVNDSNNSLNYIKNMLNDNLKKGVAQAGNFRGHNLYENTVNFTTRDKLQYDNINDIGLIVNKNPNYKTMEEISNGLKSDRISKKDVLKIKEGIRKDIDGVMPNTSKIEAMLINALGGKK